MGFTVAKQDLDWAQVATLNESDVDLIPSDLRGEEPWLQRKVPPEHILETAARLHIKPKDVVLRLRAIGFALPGRLPDWQDIGPLDHSDYEMIPWDHRGKCPGLERWVSPGHIMKAAASLGRLPEEIVKRLRALGFALPQPHPDWSVIGPLKDSDLAIICESLDSRYPYLRHNVPLSQVFGAAQKSRTAPAEIVSRIHELGYAVESPEPDWNVIGSLNEMDLQIIPNFQEGTGRKVSLDHVISAAVQTRQTPSQVIERLRTLGFPPPTPELNWDTIDHLDESDLTVIPKKPNAHEVTQRYILETAVQLARSPAEISARLRIFGFTRQKSQVDLATIKALDQSDLALIRMAGDERDIQMNDKVPLSRIPQAATSLDRAPDAIVARFLQLGFAIQLGAWPHELEAIVALWHGCSRAEANRRLTEAGWTPTIDEASAPDAVET